MKSYFFIFLLFFLISCETFKIKGKTYQRASNELHFGAVGQSKMVQSKIYFVPKGIPVLTENIQLDVRVVPFTKKIYRQETKKNITKRDGANIVAFDSLKVAPELVLIDLMDVVTYCKILNSEHNAAISDYIRETKNSKIITQLAVVFDALELGKIKTADAFYLLDLKNQNYRLGLYKDGKQIDVIEIAPSNVVGFNFSKVCWIAHKKGHWEIFDVIDHCKNCKGKSESQVKAVKKSPNLFKL